MLLAAARVLLCQSIASSRYGTQPTPLSTDTKFSFGKRWHIPDSTTSRIAFELSRNSFTVDFAYAACRPLSTVMFRSSVRSPEPMWKLIEIPISSAWCQSGSQCRSVSRGSPNTCG